mmetsp:Transcript_24482/g.50886  ORF Transcript_24482/g.50886 Transcript_24482/m.50886 type:complete len:211 (+) Transcript_24482:2620-3252(+)
MTNFTWHAPIGWMMIVCEMKEQTTCLLPYLKSMRSCVVPTKIWAAFGRKALDSLVFGRPPSQMVCVSTLHHTKRRQKLAKESEAACVLRMSSWILLDWRQLALAITKRILYGVVQILRMTSQQARIGLPVVSVPSAKSTLDMAPDWRRKPSSMKSDAALMSFMLDGKGMDTALYGLGPSLMDSAITPRPSKMRRRFVLELGRGCAPNKNL